MAGHGIQEVTDHVARIIDALDRPPVLIGHSFGGMIAEKLLGEGHGAAAVAIDAAQIKGVLPLPLCALRATLPVFKNPANRHRAVSLTADAVPLQLRQRPPAGGVRRPARAVGDPVARQAAVRGRRRELLPALARGGAHRQRGARTAAAGHGRPATTPSRRRSRRRRSSSTGTPRRSPIWSSSPIAGTRSPSTPAGARSPRVACAGCPGRGLGADGPAADGVRTVG